MSSIFELEWRHVYIWLGISALLSILFFADVFPGFRARLLDNFLPKVAPSGQIILVKIDDTSLNKIGQWPWPRQVFAELLERLESPAVVGIDVGFREASRAGSEDDAEFARALDESSFPVVLPTESNSDSESEGPLPLFAIHATEGFSDLFAEEDGVIRRAEVWKNNEPSFAYVVTAFAQRLETIPLSRNTNIARIAYHGQNGSYSSVPFIDVISGAVSADNFTNKIVLVGVTASDLQNFHRTPFGFVSGLEIQANIVDSLLTGRQWEESSEATVAAIILLSFLTTTAIVHARRVLILVLILAAVVGAYISIAAFGMAHFFALDLFYPLLAVAATALVGTVSQYLSTLERERALRETLTYLDSMVESMRDGIILVDSSLQVRLANKSARAIFGTNDLGLILNKCADALKKNIDLPDALRKSALSRATARLDEIIIAEQYFAVGIAPVQSPRDSQLPLGAIILLHDITHQKEIERIRHDFISMMVHDLRAPLGAIRDLSGELLSPDLMAEDRRSLYLNMMKDNSSKMLGLINDLLDIAKIEAGKFEVALTPVSVRSVIEDRVRFFDVSAKSKSVNLKSCIPDDVPETALLDEKYIMRAINNVLSNALKFTPAGGNITLHAFTYDGGDIVKAGESKCRVPADALAREFDSQVRQGLVIAISDTGPGIPPEKASKLFGKYIQLHRGEGTGLGLAIVKGIVEAHGGSVAVASTVGKGTVLYLLFPQKAQ